MASCKRVYIIEPNLDGSLSKSKAHHLVKGCSLTYVVDYEETLPPKIKTTLARLLISLLLLIIGFTSYTKNALRNCLCNGILEEAYIEQPPRFVAQWVGFQAAKIDACLK